MEPDWLKTAREKGLVITEGPRRSLADLEGQYLAAIKNSQPHYQGEVKITEEIFQRQVIDLAHSFGWRVAHFRKVRVAKANGETFWQTPVDADGKGFLDLELVRDRLVKMELKVGKNPMTPEQRAWAEAYAKAGVEWYCMKPEDWAEIVKILT